METQGSAQVRVSLEGIDELQVLLLSGLGRDERNHCNLDCFTLHISHANATRTVQC